MSIQSRKKAAMQTKATHEAVTTITSQEITPRAKKFAEGVVIARSHSKRKQEVARNRGKILATT